MANGSIPARALARVLPIQLTRGNSRLITADADTVTFRWKDMQSYLRDRGFYKGAIDGAFGPASQKAQRAWTAAGCPSG